MSRRHGQQIRVGDGAIGVSAGVEHVELTVDPGGMSAVESALLDAAQLEQVAAELQALSRYDNDVTRIAVPLGHGVDLAARQNSSGRWTVILMVGMASAELELDRKQLTALIAALRRAMKD